MMRRAVLFGFALAWITLPALAHAFLQRAIPAAGEALHTAPAKIELHFSEPLEASFSAIAVTAAAGRDMAAGTTTSNGSELELPLKALKPGRYRVSWHAVSADTHRSEGRYNFQVGP